jgi:hypothetical protein
MTDDIAERDAARPAAQPMQVYPGSIAVNASFARPDWYLEVLQDLANDLKVGFSFRLSVDGQVIEGTMISLDSWAQQVADRIAPARQMLEDGEEDGGPVAQAFRELFSLEGATDDDSAEDDEPTFMPRYVHLQDARVVTPSGPIDLGLWRGRLDRIGGWSFVSGPSN